MAYYIYYIAFAIYFIIPFPLLLLVSMGIILMMNTILTTDKIRKILKKIKIIKITSFNNKIKDFSYQILVI